MKIVFITREGYNLSGARVRCYNFARILKGYGIETEVFSFGDHLGAKYGEEEFEMSFSWKMRLNMMALKELFRKEKNALFFMQRLNYHSLAPFIVSLFKRQKILFDCDDWNIREDPRYYFGFYPSSKMEFLTRQLARYSVACVVASRFLEKYLKAYNKNIHYIPTGVDTETFKPSFANRSGSSITLSWMGTVYHREMCENVKFIIDCFSVLAAQFENIFLNLAGTGSFFNDLEIYTKSLPCKDRITIKGWIPPDKIPAYLEGIDIGLLPLIHNTKFNQAKSPTKLFEYMAMAKPVVSSAIGEAAGVIQEGRNGFLAKDKQGFIDKLKALIQDPALRKEIGSHARQAAEERYSLRVLGKELYEAVSLAGRS